MVLLRQFSKQSERLNYVLSEARARFAGSSGVAVPLDGSVSPPRRRARHLTKAESDALIASYCAGLPIQELRDQFGVGRTTIFMHLKRRGIPRRPVPRLTEDIVNDAVERYQRGESLAEIAATVDAGSETIRRALHTRGITLRPKGRRGSRISYMKRPAAES